MLLGTSNASVQTIKADTAALLARVGSASAVIGDKIYFFSGRGGVAMAPVDEKGAVWSLDTASDTLTLVGSIGTSPVPEARSYHCMASDGKDTLYIHAGCPEKGRLDDLWSFSVSQREWKQLASAPGPPRGGTSIAFLDGKIFRMNGFDGTHEVGGSLDVYDIASDSWKTSKFVADGKSGPGARSVAALVPVRVADDVYLVTPFGESDPSSLGHQGAGKMLSDVWAYSLNKGTWSHVDAGDGPEGRGWFDADVATIDGKQALVVAGGLGESNERLDDLWILRL